MIEQPAMQQPESLDRLLLQMQNEGWRLSNLYQWNEGWRASVCSVDYRLWSNTDRARSAAEALQSALMKIRQKIQQQIPLQSPTAPLLSAEELGL